MIKSLIKSVIPDRLLSAYHFGLAKLAAFYYKHPSSELIVIGVTGTNGKSSTVQFLGQMLEGMGEKVGWTTTASFKVGASEWLNDQKMTMLGRFQTQQMLRKMVDAGCRYAIVETSSQGILQSRHVGVDYDVAVFTNLTPEHIEAHGGFEAYKAQKLRLFKAVADSEEKVIDDKRVAKMFVANIDDEHAKDFLDFDVEKKYGFGIDGKERKVIPNVTPVIAEKLRLSGDGTSYEVQGETVSFETIGQFNAYNVLCASSVCQALGKSFESIKTAAALVKPVAGRMEQISQGQPFSVIVDYAYEPAALEAVYETIALFDVERVIHVTGSAGGGRDVARRSVIGELAAEFADVVIVTNEDPYDEDPQQIVDMVADAAIESGKVEGETLHRILDRKEAIQFALSEAGETDLVLITGKGSEPVMAVAGGKKIPWDDRKVVREALTKLGYGL